MASANGLRMRVLAEAFGWVAAVVYCSSSRAFRLFRLAAGGNGRFAEPNPAVWEDRVCGVTLIPRRMRTNDGTCMPASPEPVIREIHPGDLREVAELRWRWVVEENGRVPTVAQDEFVGTFEQWASAHAGTHHGFVAVEESGRILGMAWLAVTEQIPNPRGLGGRTADLRSVYVLPAARNIGLGGALIKTALERAAKLGEPVKWSV